MRFPPMVSLMLKTIQAQIFGDRKAEEWSRLALPGTEAQPGPGISIISRSSWLEEEEEILDT